MKKILESLQDIRKQKFEAIREFLNELERHHRGDVDVGLGGEPVGKYVSVKSNNVNSLDRLLNKLSKIPRSEYYEFMDERRDNSGNKVVVFPLDILGDEFVGVASLRLRGARAKLVCNIYYDRGAATRFMNTQKSGRGSI